MSRAAYLRELERLRGRLDELVEQAFVATEYGGEAGSPGAWSPAVDLFESEEGYVLLAEVPGVDRDDLDLTVDGRRLVLSGRRLPPRESGSFHRMERHHGPFRREFELDHELDPKGVDARLEAGVLSIRVAKGGPSRRRIKVTGEGGDDG